MKILMCNSFNYLRGGAERYFLDLSALLSSHGHKVIPFCMEDERNWPSEYSRYFVSNIDFPSQLQKNGLGAKLKVMERVLYSREAKKKIEQLIRDTKPDIAHVHGIAHETSPSILPVIKKARIPLVQTLHDYKLLCPNTNFVSQGEVCERCKGHRYFNVVWRRCKRDSLSASLLAGMEMYFHKLLQIYERNVDLFISPSLFLQKNLAEYGIKNTVIHLPNFIDIVNFQPCYESEDYFIYYGRLVSIKGISTLFEAMKHVTASHLYVAGRGEFEEPLREHARENRISNITFLGHLATQDLIPLIQHAAFTVVPSECYENCPMTILESFACGTPVIGANIGGIPELIKNDRNGLLFESGNAQQLAEKIQFLLDNPQQIIAMGRNGRQQVETVNNPQYHYQQTIEIYQHLLHGNGTA